MTQHNKGWTSWNVSLWINNDEGLYREAKHAIRVTDNRDEAARYMLDSLHQADVTHTPDGAKFSVSSIKKAMVGI